MDKHQQRVYKMFEARGWYILLAFVRNAMILEFGMFVQNDAHSSNNSLLGEKSLWRNFAKTCEIDMFCLQGQILTRAINEMMGNLILLNLLSLHLTNSQNNSCRKRKSSLCSLCWCRKIDPPGDWKSSQIFCKIKKWGQTQRRRTYLAQCEFKNLDLLFRSLCCLNFLFLTFSCNPGESWIAKEKITMSVSDRDSPTKYLQPDFLTRSAIIKDLVLLIFCKKAKLNLIVLQNS